MDARDGTVLAKSSCDELTVHLVKHEETDTETQKMIKGTLFVLLLDMALCFQNLGNFREARDCISEASVLQPEHLYIEAFSLSIEYHDQKNHKKSKMSALYERIVACSEKLKLKMKESIEPFAAMTSNLISVHKFMQQLSLKSKEKLNELTRKKKSFCKHFYSECVNFVNGKTDQRDAIELREQIADCKSLINWRMRVASKIKRQLLRMMKLAYFNEGRKCFDQLNSALQSIYAFQQELKSLLSISDWNAVVTKSGNKANFELTNLPQKQLLLNALLAQLISTEINDRWEKVNVPLPILTHVLSKETPHQLTKEVSVQESIPVPTKLVSAVKNYTRNKHCWYLAAIAANTAFLMGAYSLLKHLI